MFSRNKRYTAAQLDGTETIEQSPSDLSGTLLRVRPHPENNGMHDAAGLLQALYDLQESALGRNTSKPCSFELWFNEGLITFYLYAPTESAAEKYKRRVGNAYNNTAITPVEAKECIFPVVGPDDYVAGGEIYTEKAGQNGTFLPIQHFRDGQGFDKDPYGQITSALLSTEESKVVLQVVFKPISRDWTDGGLLTNSVHDEAERLRADDVVWDPIPRPREASQKDKEKANIIENQHRKMAFQTNMRLLAISPKKSEAEARAKDLGGMFSPFYNSTTEQGLEQDSVRGWPSGRRAKKLRDHLSRMQRREYVDVEMILTGDELAGIAHIPIGDEKDGINTPRIDWRHARRGSQVDAGTERHQQNGDESDETAGSAAAAGDD